MLNLWVSSLLVILTQAATPDQWRSRSIYQVVTDRFALDDGGTNTCDTTQRQRCGGTWKGLQGKLDYIQGMGFDSIWISPISKNIDGQTPYGEAYHGYWTQNLDQLNPYFGTQQDLQNLVSAVHERGMYIMVDNVPNHMAHGEVSSPPSFTGTNANIDLSLYSPFNQASDYHPFCLVDYSNVTSTEQCWMGDLKVQLMDLNTDSASVSSRLLDYIRNTTDTFGIDGVRVDAVKSIAKSFWKPWNQAAGVYAMGEVYTGDPGVMCAYQDNALDGLLNFPVWEALVGGFNATTESLAYVMAAQQNVGRLCSDSTLLGSFIENQDLPRFKAYTTDDTLSHNAITYVFLDDGIPVLYYGYEQGFSGANDPANREPMWSSKYSTTTTQYGWVKKLNAFRHAMILNDAMYQPTQMTELVNNAPTRVVSFAKGNTIVVTSNYGSGSGSTGIVVTTSLTSGTQMLEMYTNSTVSVGSNGALNLMIKDGAPMVLYPAVLAGCVAVPSNRTCAVKVTTAQASASGSIRIASATATGSTAAQASASGFRDEPRSDATSIKAISSILLLAFSILLWNL